MQEQLYPEKPTVAFCTLGCKVNQHDSDAMAALFQDAGYEIIPFQYPADVYVINTCTVTHLSDRKSRQMIRRAVTQNPAAIVVVCGCYAQTSASEVAQIQGVDLVIGTNERQKIVHAVEEYRKYGEQRIYLPSEDDLFEFEKVSDHRVSKMTRAYVKIEEGCNQFCSYCIIPYARGPVRSRRVSDTVEEINRLYEQGYREVILTGIHIGVFGQGLKDEKTNLTELCRAILKDTEMPRIRLGSIECTEITPELIDLMIQETRMARHLHIPLQAGSDTILKAMNRPYNQDEFRNIVRDVRAKIPGIAITTDLMVGFPGETDDDFRESLIFVNAMAFSDMHVFKYSMRNGTPAANMINQIDPEVKDRRAKMVAEIAQKNHVQYLRNHLGKEMEVLLEEPISENLWRGHTSNYLNVHVNGPGEHGSFVQALLEDIQNNTLQGKIINEKYRD